MTSFTQNQRQIIDQALNIIAEKLPTTADAVTSPDLVKEYLKLFFADKMEREHFVVMFLNSQHQMIACEVLFTGTIDGAAVYPREIVRAVLLHNAAAIILAHNHPSGVCEPSMADKNITQRIVDGCKLMEIRVLDHIVVGKDCYSFAESGLI